jgi:hypothetical protein
VTRLSSDGSDRALHDGIDECAGERLAGEPGAVPEPTD